MKRKIVMLLALVFVLACVGALADSIRFTGDCNVRSGPGLGYGVIGSVNTGSYLPYQGSSKVDSRGVTWYKVSFGGGSGWVSSVYGTVTGGSGSATYGGGGSNGGYSSKGSGGYSSGSTVYAGSGDTNVRTGPGLGYASVGTLYQGQSATYLGDTSYDNRGVAWYRIRWDGQARWVSSVYTWIR